MEQSIDRDESTRDKDVHKQDKRGYDDGFSVSNLRLTEWADSRDLNIVSQYKSEFSLGDMVTVQIGVSGNGSVLIEGRKVSTPYSGKFFTKNEMELTAVPTGSAVFAGWSDGNTSNPRKVQISGAASYTANFK